MLARRHGILHGPIWLTIVAALLSSTASAALPSCLPGAVPASSRTNVSINGVSMPFKIYPLGWASAHLLGELARIVLSERMGFNVEHLFQEAGPPGTWPAGGDWEVRHGYMSTMGCVPPWNWMEGRPACNIGPPETAIAHVTFEYWMSYSADT
jgi:hypothetical protein